MDQVSKRLKGNRRALVRNRKFSLRLSSGSKISGGGGGLTVRGASNMSSKGRFLNYVFLAAEIYVYLLQPLLIVQS